MIDFASGYEPINDKCRLYFIGGLDRKRYSYDAIGQKVKGTAVEGKHIMRQLDFLGLYETFAKGETPHGLPYSFSSYAPKPR